MKAMFLCLSCIASLNYAQEPEVVTWGAPEMYIHLINVLPLSHHNFSLSRLSVAYCYEHDAEENPTFVKCSICQDGCDDCDAGEPEDDIQSDQFGVHASTQYGYGLCSIGTGTKEPHYGFGIYKFEKLDNGKYIFINLWDTNYSREAGGGYRDDFVVRYNGSNGGFFEYKQSVGATHGILFQMVVY